MSPSSLAGPAARATLTLWGGLLVLMLLTRPHNGIFHDGALYAVQALAWLSPDAYADDLFFAFGNQDSFTLFSVVYAPLIAVLGLSAATAFLWLAGLLIWLFAAVLLARRVMPDPQTAAIAVAAVLLLHPGYGNMQLTYAEPHVTPRIWAEALSMIGVACALQRRHACCALAMGAALLLHPLIALSGAVLAFWLLCTRKAVFLATAAVAFLLALSAAALGISPFAWMVQRIDAAWWQVIHDHVPLVQVSQWGVTGLLAWTPLPALSLWLMWRDGDRQLRDLIAGVVLLTLSFTLISLVAVDLLHNRLFTALQLWRAQLWFALIGNLMAWPAWRGLQGPARSLFATAAVLTIAAALLGLPPFTGACLAGAAFFAQLETGRWRMLPVAILMLIAATTLPVIFLVLAKNDTPALLWRLAPLPVAAMAAWALLRPAPALLLVCAIAALLLVDKRPGWQVEPAGATPPPKMMAGKSVYWENGWPRQWYDLRQPSYYACRQLSGVVFYRDQALEVMRRAAGLQGLATADFAPGLAGFCPFAGPETGDARPLSERVQRACTALPDLDIIVVEQDVSDIDSRTSPMGSSPYAPQHVPVWARADRGDTPPALSRFDCASYR